MQVPIHNEDPLEAVLTGEVTCPDRNVIENAEAHGLSTLRVVARRPHESEPIIDLARKKRITQLQESSHRHTGSLVRFRRSNRIRVQTPLNLTFCFGDK